MNQLNVVSGTAYPLGLKDVNTDTIIPSRFLKKTTRSGMGEGAFEPLRSQPNNIFDNEKFTGSPFLIAGENFGCGSSREHAAWALSDMGIRVVIAPSFSDLFSSNAFKNGILTVLVQKHNVEELIQAAQEGTFTLDLSAQTLAIDSGSTLHFEIDAFRKHCLLNGLDEIGVTLELDDEITAYEQRRRQRFSWLDSSLPKIATSSAH